MDEKNIDTGSWYAQLITLGNSAKSAGDNSLANCIFAAGLVRYWTLGVEDRDGTSDGPPAVRLELETQDYQGGPGEAYYDLLVLVTDYPLPGCSEWSERRLCIPAPLLPPLDLLAAVKVADIVDRRDHGGREIISSDAVSTEIVTAAAKLCDDMTDSERYDAYLTMTAMEADPEQSMSRFSLDLMAAVCDVSPCWA